MEYSVSTPSFLPLVSTPCSPSSWHHVEDFQGLRSHLPQVGVPSHSSCLYTQSSFRPTVRELGILIVDAMGIEDSHAIMNAEGEDALAWLLHSYASVDICLMYALGDKHFDFETGFGSIDTHAA